MGFGRGFDIYPRLEPTEANDELYERFLNEIMRTYVNEPGNEDSWYSSEEKVAVLVPKKNGAYIEFKVGEHPTIPYNGYCQYFLRFSSKVSGPRTSLAEPYIIGVGRIAKKYFGDRVKPWYEPVDTDDERAWGYSDWDQVREAEREMMERLEA